MPKRTKQKEEQRLLRIGHADISERERINTQLAENNELQKELVQLRQRYRITFKNAREQVRWLSSQSLEVLANFSTDIKLIKNKYAITEKANDSFWSAVWNMPKTIVEPNRSLGGLPGISYSKEHGIQLVITPETDIDNSLVREFIKNWQMDELEKQPPPQPQKIKGSRKLDWRPVWEWHLKHPQITIKELAKKLNRDYRDVKQKLKELDKQIDNSPFLDFQK